VNEVDGALAVDRQHGIGKAGDVHGDSLIRRGIRGSLASDEPFWQGSHLVNRGTPS
jgi:hypothetical protein